MQGLSARNLGYMKAFAEAWPEEPILQQAVAKLPWGHNVRLLDLVKSRDERLWYVEQAIQNGWSRNVFVIQIEGGLYRFGRERQSLTFRRLCQRHSPILLSSLSRIRTTSIF